MNLKRGLLLPTIKASLKFGSVLKNTPPVPLILGHYQMVQEPWGMLLNNSKSCCVVSGACHETMLLGAMGGHQINFSDGWVETDYVAMQGNPLWPFNDQGLDMLKAAEYRRKFGVHDALGVRHRIDAYADIGVGDLEALGTAVKYLGCAGTGFNLPANAESLWQEAQPWEDTSQPPSGEGHYVATVGRNSRGDWLCVTWGRLQAYSDEWFRKYNICNLAYLSREQLNSQGLSPDQYDDAALVSYIKGLGHA